MSKKLQLACTLKNPCCGGRQISRGRLLLNILLGLSTLADGGEWLSASSNLPGAFRRARRNCSSVTDELSDEPLLVVVEDCDGGEVPYPLLPPGTSSSRPLSASSF